MAERVPGRKPSEFRPHGGIDRHPAECPFELREADLSGGAHPHEERDDHEDRVRHHGAHERKQHRYPLPSACGQLRGSDVIEPHGEQRPQHTSAVHRKRGQQVESRESRIDQHQPFGERHVSREPLEPQSGSL